jgi:hypothetical protein
MILPNVSDAAGQHCPLQQWTFGGQHWLVAPLVVFAQMAGLVPDAQAPQVLVLAFWHFCPEGQQTLPHACSVGQHVLLMQAPAQQTPLQQTSNPQNVLPQGWPKPQRPLLQTAPPVQHTSPHRVGLLQQTFAPVELVRQCSVGAQQESPHTF